MARKPTTNKAEAELDRFQMPLSDEDAALFREAIAKDDESENAEGLHVKAFWARMSVDHRFDVKTLRTEFMGVGKDDSILVSFVKLPEPELAGHGDEGAAERAHETAVERMERLGADAAIDVDTLLGDVRDFLLDMFKSRPKPWGQCSEAEQRDIAAAAEFAAKDVIRKVVEAVRSDGRDSIRALLESFTEKDGIKATIKIKPLDEDDALAAIVGLHKAQGKHVLITVASADDYDGERRQADIDPDAPAMSFDAPSGDGDLADEETETAD